MHKVGSVSLLFYSPPLGRINTSSFILDKQGICDDKHHNKNTSRSVLIASKESYLLANKHHIEIPFGALGENILIDYNPYHLQEGQKIQIGTTILSINQACTLCKSLSKIDKELPKLLKEDRGIFAQVLVSGCIQEGDSVFLLDS